MTEMTNIKKISSFSSVLGETVNKAVPVVSRVLTFSLADDLIAPQKNLSVSINRGNVSVAYGARFFSRISIKGLKEYSFEDDGYPQPEDLVSSLSLAVNEFNTSHRDITLILPKAWTIIRTVEFPSSVKENLPDVISYELDRLTPFTAEEAFFDFRLMEEKDNRVSLVLMAAKADQIMPYIDALNEKGFSVGRLTVDLAALGTAARYRDKKSDTLVVEIGTKGYEGGFFIHGLPAGTFSGSTAGLDEKTKAETIAGEVKHLLSVAGKGSTPEVLFWLKEKSPVLRELLASSRGLSVSIMGETDMGLKLSSSPMEIPWAAVGGVMQSLWTDARGFDLLGKGRPKKQKTPLGLTILLMLSIAVIWIIYMVAPLKVEEKRLAEISRQTDAKKAEARKVEALKKDAESLAAEIAVINNFKNDKPMTLNILKELTTTLPNTAWLTRARITTTSVDIEGYAATATLLLPKLEASKYFRKVEFASPTIKDQRLNAERFNIKMELEGTVSTKGESIKNEKK